MKILIAKTAGFCMGVRRAVELALDSPRLHGGPIYTYGPLIHNPQVLKLIAEKGISVLERIPPSGTGTVIIRAHGIPPQTKAELKKSGFAVIDATCPRVIKVQTIIRNHSEKGYAVIIIGDSDHPEVIGLSGYAGEKGHVVNSWADLENLPPFHRAIIVAQTTQNTAFFDQVKRWAQRYHPHYKIFDTICDSTARRQAEVKRLAETVDRVIVVGGRNSGNTQRLVETAREAGTEAHHIETEADLKSTDLEPARLIAITAGASTPNWIIRDVYRALESLPYQTGGGWRKWMLALQRILLLTNIYVSLGAGCLAYACTALLGIADFIPAVIIAVLYVQSMHTLNHLWSSREDRYNDPGRAAFYQRHRYGLVALAVASGAAGLLIAYTVGKWAFLVLLIMSILGLCYNLRLVPASFSPFKHQRIRDLPGSKTVLIALAWGVATALFPFLASGANLNLAAVFIFLWAAGMVFARTAFFDILDMQGDRIVGKETIPILLGERRTLRMLKAFLILLAFLTVLLSLLRLTATLGFWLPLCPLFLLGTLAAHEKGYMIPGIRLEFLVESHFLFAGLVAMIWKTL